MPKIVTTVEPEIAFEFPTCTIWHAYKNNAPMRNLFSTSPEGVDEEDGFGDHVFDCRDLPAWNLPVVRGLEDTDQASVIDSVGFEMRQLEAIRRTIDAGFIVQGEPVRLPR